MGRGKLGGERDKGGGGKGCEKEKIREGWKGVKWRRRIGKAGDTRKKRKGKEERQGIACKREGRVEKTEVEGKER